MYLCKIKNNILSIMDLQTLIVERRKQIGATQEELSDVCDISCSYLKLIEQGKANPTIEILWKILDALGFELKVYDKFTQKEVL